MHKEQKRIFKQILTISMIFLFLTGFRLLWLHYHTPPEQPFAHQGILDLRNYELPEKQSITLNGEWAFFPETLIDPYLKEDTMSSAEHRWISVPTKKQEDASYRLGTFHLRILLDEQQVQNQRYGLQMPSLKTASALFMNGQLVAESGKVATNRHEHIGQDAPYTVFFTANQQEINLVLHMSNFDTPENIGIGKSVVFGSEKSIVSAQNDEKMLVFSIVVILLMYSLYSLLIYIFVSRKKIILFFAVGFLFPAIDELVSDNKGVLQWLHLDYEWSLKFLTLMYLGASFFFVQLMRVLLTNYQRIQIFRWFTVLYGLCALAMIIMPTHYLLPANTLFFLLYFVSFISVVVLAFKEYIEDREESFFLIFTTLSTTSGIVWGVIKGYSMLEIPFYPFDYLFAFLGFAVFWFKRFYRKQTKVEELVTKLQEADKLKDDFLTNNSQKLWSPLNEMITIAQMIYDGNRGMIVAQDKEDLKYLINIGRSMSFVLNDLLDFTRLKEQTIQIHPKSTALQSAVTGVFDMLTFIADGKQIQMTSTIPKTFPHVLADETRLIQILFNLLHNAIKYTEVGVIVVHAEVRNGMASIHIQDSGLGMDTETQKRILAPYEQGMVQDEGVGLGVSVCKQLIELHGGTLQIKSIPNQGTDFIFTLPLAEDRPIEERKVNVSEETDTNDASHSISFQEEQSCSKQFSMLVIDDDPITLKVISTIFSSEQYEVVTVTSSQAALNLLDKKEWDLIILDAMMPYMSGYELTRVIREHYSVVELPILLLTARSYPEDVYTGFSLGANDYVTKPINSLELKFRGQALIHFKQAITERLYMESAWLQAQIQPHFLFNTLNTIASLSTIDSERMVGLLNKFGEYLRGSFDVKNLKRIVPLEQELELIRSYLYIEQERFGDRLQVIWEVDDNIMVEVPPISIQILVENAIRHGVLKKLDGGTVCIRITNYLDHTRITVIDDGIGMDEEQLSQILDEDNTLENSVGLRNTNRRLKRIYGQGLQISSVPNQGTEITFTIPK